MGLNNQQWGFKDVMSPECGGGRAKRSNSISSIMVFHDLSKASGFMYIWYASGTKKKLNVKQK